MIFLPDYVAETFEPGTDQAAKTRRMDVGSDISNGDADPDPADTTYIVDYAFLLERRMARCASITIGISRDYFRARRGWTLRLGRTVRDEA